MNMTDNQEFDQIVTGVSITCDGTTDDGEGNCTNTPEWYMIFHDCNAEMLCEDCTRHMVIEVLGVIGQFGKVGCSQCHREWQNPNGFIRVRRI